MDIRRMECFELDRIREIDRAEEVDQCYVCQDGAVHLKEARHSVPPWTQDGQDGHSVASKVLAWRPLLIEGGTMFGAFEGSSLAAFAIYRPRLTPTLAQLAVLHVSRPHRRRGLGAALTARVVESAKKDGATHLYVSASPTRGTVDFYRALGFQLTPDPHPPLLELEPDDIHMIMPL